jgi:hypothetical protein
MRCGCTLVAHRGDHGGECQRRAERTALRLELILRPDIARVISDTVPPGRMRPVAPVGAVRPPVHPVGRDHYSNRSASVGARWPAGFIIGRLLKPRESLT